MTDNMIFFEKTFLPTTTPIFTKPTHNNDYLKKNTKTTAQLPPH